MTSKRYRDASNGSLSLSPSPEPTPKAVRTALPSVSSSSSSPLLCTLPPTCNPPHNPPTPLANTSQLEAHYATYHAHVCEERGCGCVFPDAKLLELHQTECHDPLAAVRKDRGEKIFACHVSTCSRHFLTPKARRLHLIQAHGYPKEYFFAVTNKGVGGLLKKWGEGVSMIRGQWKERDRSTDGGDSDGLWDNGSEDESEEDADSAEASEKDDIEMEAHDRADAIAHAIRTEGGTSSAKQGKKREIKADQDEAVDTLTGALDSLSLVPPNIRFGRGVRRGGLAAGNGGVVSRGAGVARGGLRARGRGAVHAPAPVSGHSVGRGMSEAQTRGSTRGILGAGNLRRGVRGFPAARASVLVNARGVRGMGRGRGVRGAGRGGAPA